MTNEKKDKIQIVEPFVLFNNLAEGALLETDDGIKEWASQHGLDIAAVAEDNRKHLRDAVKFAREELPVTNSANALPTEVTTIADAKFVINTMGDGFRLASRNASIGTEADLIRRANQMLELNRRKSEN